MYHMKNNNNEKKTVILFSKREKRQRGMISIQSITFYCCYFFHVQKHCTPILLLERKNTKKIFIMRVNKFNLNSYHYF